MKKKYLNLFVCTLLLGGATTGLVSCKDYDDDITSLNTSTDGLNKQLGSLQTALQSAQDAAKAAQDAADRALAAAKDAQNAGDAAMAAAQRAEAEAELAKKAAADAKAEAIAAVIEQLKPLIDANASANAENAAAIAALKGRIDGIEQGLANIDLTDINKQLGAQADLIAAQAKQIQTIETQLKALNQLQKDLNDKLGGVDGIAAKLDQIATLQGDLKALQGRVAANESAIKAVQGELTALSAKISTEVSNAVNTIAGTLSKRLTSVTLMPDVYVDGIPTIEFVSAKYIKQVWSQNEGWHDAPATVNKRQFIIHNNSAQAQYRLNPASIQNEDIEINNLAYVTRKATTRAAEVVDDIVTVSKANVGDNGILTVNLGKGNTESLNTFDLGANQIYTVSLKVPVAAKHLFGDNGEKEAIVYSEFTRLSESYFKPELAFKAGSYIGTNSHPQDSTYYLTTGGAGYAAGAGIVKNLVYNKTFNLYDLVWGCEFYAPDNHKLINIEQVRAYGMDIKFHIPNVTYAPTADKTNQQVFAKLSGTNNSTLTPVSVTGQTGNQVIIGKQPVIAATLIDVTNGNVISQKYFKVCFSAENMQDIVINWQDITTAGQPCSGAAFDFTWSEMGKRVLEKLNDNKGMSEEDFVKIYGAVAPVIDPANDANGTLTVNMVYDPAASIPVMTWSLTPEQLVNLTAAHKLVVGDNKLTVTKTVKFVDKLGLHANVVMNLKWTVTVHVDAVTLGTEQAAKWTNGTMLVYPVPMAIPYDGKTATYMTNILEGRDKPYVKGLLSCGRYDINYAVTGNPLYHGEPLILQNPFTHWSFTTANQANLNKINYTIANTQAGQQLIVNSKVIKIDWSNDINGFAANRYVFGTTNLKFVPILKLNPILTDGFVDNSRKQELNIADKYTLTDAYGHLVAAVNPANATGEDVYAADRYKYYGVQAADFTGEIMLSYSANGANPVKLSDLNMSADVNNATGVLTFQNNGSPLRADAYLIVPVKVKHLWGSYDDTMLKGNIAVPIKKVLDGKRR